MITNELSTIHTTKHKATQSGTQKAHGTKKATTDKWWLMVIVNESSRPAESLDSRVSVPGCLVNQPKITHDPAYAALLDDGLAACVEF